MSYVTKEELDETINPIREDIESIKDNHLPSIYSLLGQVFDKVNDLKWFIIAGTTGLGVVITMIHFLG